MELARTSVPDWKKQTISLTGEVIANTTAPIVHFDVNLPEGIYYFTDMTQYKAVTGTDLPGICSTNLFRTRDFFT